MKNRFSSEHFSKEDDEPLGPLANLVDIILVFACGLIAALVALSPNLQEHFKVSKNTPITSQGKELSNVPENLKDSPIDKGKEIFEELMKNKVQVRLENDL